MNESDIQRLRSVLARFEPAFQREIENQLDRIEQFEQASQFDDADLVWEVVLVRLENETLKRKLFEEFSSKNADRETKGILNLVSSLREVIGEKPHNGRSLVQARVRSASWPTVVNNQCVLLQVCLPRHDQGDYQTFDVINGQGIVQLQAGSKLDENNRLISGKLPWGKFPRLLLFYINSYVYAYRQQRIFLGHSAAQFFDKLGLSRQGYTYDSFHEQLDRLIRCGLVSGYRYSETGYPESPTRPFSKEGSRTSYHNVSSQVDEFRNSQREQALEIILEDSFYQSMIDNPLHVDLDVIKGFGKNLLAMDIYVMLAERLPHIEEGAEEEISREDLVNLFGSGQGDKGKFFRESFKPALQLVHDKAYKTANFCLEKQKLVLQHSPPASELPKDLPPLL